MDYSLHQLYKSQPQLNIDYISIQIQNKSTEELSQALLDIVNEANGTNISLPEVVLNLTDKTKEELKSLVCKMI